VVQCRASRRWAVRYGQQRGFATREHSIFGDQWWLYFSNRIAEEPERVFDAIIVGRQMRSGWSNLAPEAGDWADCRVDLYRVKAGFAGATLRAALARRPRVSLQARRRRARSSLS
jgi:hypothetical protein